MISLPTKTSRPTRDPFPNRAPNTITLVDGWRVQLNTFRFVRLLDFRRYSAHAHLLAWCNAARGSRALGTGELDTEPFNSPAGSDPTTGVVGRSSPRYARST
eukprot:8429366-Pyramimonas_sp.AAC.2